MTILLLLTIIVLSGGASGYITGTVARHYSLGAIANTVFGILGGMVCLHLLNSTGIAPSAEAVIITHIALYAGCGIVGGGTLALIAGFVQRTA